MTMDVREKCDFHSCLRSLDSFAAHLFEREQSRPRAFRVRAHAPVALALKRVEKSTTARTVPTRSPPRGSADRTAQNHLAVGVLMSGCVIARWRSGAPEIRITRAPSPHRQMRFAPGTSRIPPTTAQCSPPYFSNSICTTSSFRSCAKSITMSGSLSNAMRSLFRNRRK